MPTNLAAWLDYIEALHPKSIAMGLDRVNEVKQRLNLNPQFPIVIVAGTNGKGSTCAMLEHIYHAAMLDPHTASVLDLEQIRSMVDELLLAHRQFLPDYFYS